jgi:hypothetical protein
VVNGRILTRLIPDARLEVIRDGGHLFPLEQPTEIAALVAEFSANRTVMKLSSREVRTLLRLLRSAQAPSPDDEVRASEARVKRHALPHHGGEALRLRDGSLDLRSKQDTDRRPVVADPFDEELNRAGDRTGALRQPGPWHTV